MYIWDIMALAPTMVAATKLREHGSEIINKVAYGDDEVILTRRGKPVAAVVSLKALEALHAFEDARDIAEAARARREIKKHGTVSHDEVKARLGL